MAVKRFFFRSKRKVGTRVILQGNEAHHLATVIRAGIGQEVVLFNEIGEEFIASITKISSQCVTLTVLKELDSKVHLLGSIHLAIALVKGKALEKVLSSATELAVDKIIVYRCARSGLIVMLTPFCSKFMRLARPATPANGVVSIVE